MRRLLVHLLAALAALVVHGLLWGWSYADFSRSVDFNAGPLEDFMGPYLDTARAVAAGRAPAPGFLYGPFFALLLRPFAEVSPGAASWIWLGFELLASFALVSLALGLVRPSRPVAATHTFVALLSFPLVHNLHWGQVSVPLAALLLAAARLHLGGRPAAAAWVIAAATAIKVYPALFLAPLLLSRERRVLGHVLGASVLLLVAAPALALGFDATFDVYRASFEALAAAARGWQDAPNAQYFGAVVVRWLGAEGTGAQAVCAALGGLWAVGHVILASRRIRAGGEGALVEAYALVALALPLVVYPCWPHYLALLPFAQLVAFTRRPRDPLTWLGVGVSVSLASAPFFRWVGDPASYGRAGWLLVAHLVLLPAFYRSRTGQSPPSRASIE